MSRCREPARQTSAGGFHKESLSIHPLIPLARGLAIVTFHAQFQLVLAAFVPVAERRGVPFQGNIFGYLGEDEIKARAIAPRGSETSCPGDQKGAYWSGGTVLSLDVWLSPPGWSSSCYPRTSHSPAMFVREFWATNGDVRGWMDRGGEIWPGFVTWFVCNPQCMKEANRSLNQ